MKQITSTGITLPLASMRVEVRMMMPAGDQITVCDFCKAQRVTWRTEEMTFRQSSDKGYVHCRVELAVGTCQNCGLKSLEPDSDRILDAAFLAEYRKLP